MYGFSLSLSSALICALPPTPTKAGASPNHAQGTTRYRTEPPFAASKTPRGENARQETRNAELAPSTGATHRRLRCVRHGCRGRAERRAERDSRARSPLEVDGALDPGGVALRDHE